MCVLCGKYAGRTCKDENGGTPMKKIIAIALTLVMLLGCAMMATATEDTGLVAVSYSRGPSRPSD